jgi:hypothetical protein
LALVKIPRPLIAPTSISLMAPVIAMLFRKSEALETKVLQILCVSKFKELEVFALLKCNIPEE